MEIRMFERDVQRSQPIRPLGVAGRRDMLKEDRVFVETRSHAGGLSMRRFEGATASVAKTMTHGRRYLSINRTWGMTLQCQSSTLNHNRRLSVYFPEGSA
jgi:hypothetical protein